MGRLADAYLAPRGTAAGDAGDAPERDDPGLEAALAALLARGRAAHPTLRVEDTAFAARLARCGASINPGAHAEDLYLACAALEGDEAAHAR
jgi:hypothetical protein